MTARQRYPRSNCCVPFCARWSTLFRTGDEWMCGKHWRLADRQLRRFFSARMKQLHATWATTPPDSPEQRRAAARYWRTNELIWRRIKRQVVTRAAGAPL